jgi:16S rRNA (adenine1518-N6/adenine1519-N6)-dimethyltransferase
MTLVRPKKSLGQHFLKDQNISRKIVDSLDITGECQVLEIGPGMGILTRLLLQNPSVHLSVVEIDRESVLYLENHFREADLRIISGDILKIQIDKYFTDKFCVIGNFPYNISSQIFFRLLEYRSMIPQVVCMVQKEVAERFSASPGSKTYGILSVLLQSFYDIEYLFTVSENVFAPPPKVKSAVIRLKRNHRSALDCDEKLFQTVVKTSFNQRRKILGNALKQKGFIVPPGYSGKRAEQLSVDQFIELTNLLQESKIEES